MMMEEKGTPHCYNILSGILHHLWTLYRVSKIFSIFWNMIEAGNNNLSNLL